MSSPQWVEALCDELRNRAGTSGRIDLWVSDELSLGDAELPMNPTGAAMAIILDTALSLTFGQTASPRQWTGGPTTSRPSTPNDQRLGR